MAKSIPDKKFIEIIKHFPIDKIAFGRFGSRAVEGIEFHITLNFSNFSFFAYRVDISNVNSRIGLWKNGSIKLRAALCEMLKEVHVELGQSQFGRHVNHKLRVTEYVKGKQPTLGFRFWTSKSRRSHFIFQDKIDGGRIR